MTLEDFHQNFRAELQDIIRDRAVGNNGGDNPFPAEELVFAEIVMDRMAEAGLFSDPKICHWTGKIGNAKLGITGFALSQDETELNLFITQYLGVEQLTTVDNNVIQATGEGGVRFLFRASAGNLQAVIAPIHPVHELLAIIKSRWTEFDKLRVYVITDGKTKAKEFSNIEVQGKIVSLQSVDMERLYRWADKPRDELEVSFLQWIGRPLPCVHVPDPDADYEYALTAIPGQVIRELYIKFGARLLEANVRTFLGNKKPANAGIIETLKKEPAHFLAFNNGLVLVCDKADFERTEDGSIGLSFIQGIQIVNGGQTTSTIYFASRADKTIDLSHVMVPAKIIILKGSNDEAREKLITDVSKYANTQSVVKVSDLSANRPFHRELEKLANETWCPDGRTRWFYERAAGAYNIMFLRDANTPASRQRLRDMIPSKRKLTKNDIAKYHEAWRGRPVVVAGGGEKNFAAFMKELDASPGIVPSPLDGRWYRQMIAKVILFKTIEDMIKKRDAREIFHQGWGNIATYVVSVVADKLGERLNLEQIWQKQEISKSLSNLLWEWSKVVNAEFIRIAPGAQISEVAKRADTWPRLRSANYRMNLEGIPEIK